jgi:hypothetical protein
MRILLFSFLFPFLSYAELAELEDMGSYSVSSSKAQFEDKDIAPSLVNAGLLKNDDLALPAEPNSSFQPAPVIETRVTGHSFVITPANFELNFIR